jgi:hypothetical protein
MLRYKLCVFWQLNSASILFHACCLSFQDITPDFLFSTICLFCATRLTSNCSSSLEKLPDGLVELLALVLVVLQNNLPF